MRSTFDVSHGNCVHRYCGAFVMLLLLLVIVLTTTAASVAAGSQASSPSRDTAECSSDPDVALAQEKDKATRLFDPTPQELSWLKQAPVCERCRCATNKVNGGGVCFDPRASSSCQLTDVRDCVLALMSRVRAGDSQREKFIHRIVNVLVKAGMQHEGAALAFGTHEVRDGLAHWMGFISESVDAAVSLAASVLILCEQEATAQRFATEGIRDGLLHLLDVVREVETDDDDDDNASDRFHRSATVLAAMNAVCSSAVGAPLCAVPSVRDRLVSLIPVAREKSGIPLSVALIEGVSGFLANLCVTPESKTLFGASSVITEGLLSFSSLPAVLQNNATVRSVAGALLNLCVDHEANAQMLAGHSKLVPALAALASGATTDESAHHILGIVRALAGTRSAANQQQRAPSSSPWALSADSVLAMRDSVVLVASRSVQHAVTVTQFASALINLYQVFDEAAAATTVGSETRSTARGAFATNATVLELLRLATLASSPEAATVVAEALVAVSTDGSDEGRRLLAAQGTKFIAALEYLAAQSTTSSAADAVAMVLAHVSSIPDSAAVVNSPRVQTVFLRLAERVKSDAGVRTVMAALVHLCVNFVNGTETTQVNAADTDSHGASASAARLRPTPPPFSFVQWVTAVWNLSTTVLLPLVTTDPTAAYFASAISALASLPTYRSLLRTRDVRDALLRVSEVSSSDGAARSIAAALQVLCALPSTSSSPSPLGNASEGNADRPTEFLTEGVRDALAKVATLTETPATAEVVAGAILNFCESAGGTQRSSGEARHQGDGKTHLCADHRLRDSLLLLFPVAHTDTTALRLTGIVWHVWKSSDEGRNVFGCHSVLAQLLSLKERISSEAFALRMNDVIRQVFPHSRDSDDELLEPHDDDDVSNADL